MISFSFSFSFSFLFSSFPLYPSSCITTPSSAYTLMQVVTQPEDSKLKVSISQMHMLATNAIPSA